MPLHKGRGCWKAASKGARQDQRAVQTEVPCMRAASICRQWGELRPPRPGRTPSVPHDCRVQHQAVCHKRSCFQAGDAVRPEEHANGDLLAQTFHALAPGLLQFGAQRMLAATCMHRLGKRLQDSLQGRWRSSPLWHHRMGRQRTLQPRLPQLLRWPAAWRGRRRGP